MTPTERVSYPTVNINYFRWTLRCIERAAEPHSDWRSAVEMVTAEGRATLALDESEAVLGRLFALTRALRARPGRRLHACEFTERSLIAAALVAPCHRTNGFRRRELLRLAGLFMTSPRQVGTA